METIQIEIVNPKAKSLIQNLAKMDLIRIKKEKTKSEFVELLDRFRMHSASTPSFEEISSVDCNFPSTKYKLSDFQKERISLGRDQLKNGQAIPNDELQSEIDQWLSTK